MSKKEVTEWLEQPSIKQILLSFYSPRTPKMVEQIISINKLKLKPFLERNLLKPLNPEAKKGRLYVITNRARKLLKLPVAQNHSKVNWPLRGWIMASPRQRLVVLKTLDSTKRTSEEIREKAQKLNPCMSRISTKTILNDLVDKRLAETELMERKRYYWISKIGTEYKNLPSMA